MRALRSIVVAFVSLAACPSSTNTQPAPPPAPPPPPAAVGWCGFVKSAVTIPAGMECQEAPGYYALGFFGNDANPVEYSFSYFLPKEKPVGFEETVTPGGTAGRTFDAQSSIDAKGSLDLGAFPTAVSQWLPQTHFATSTGDKVKVRIQLTKIEYRRLHQTLVALDDAIKSGAGGLEGTGGCNKLKQFRDRLCMKGVRASTAVMVATPVIEVKSATGHSLDAGAAAVTIATATYSKKQAADDTVLFESNQPLGIAVQWTRYDGDPSCASATPACPAPPPPPPIKPVHCEPSKHELARGACAFASCGSAWARGTASIHPDGRVEAITELETDNLLLGPCGYVEWSAYAADGTLVTSDKTEPVCIGGKGAGKARRETFPTTKQVGTDAAKKVARVEVVAKCTKDVP